MGSPRKKAPTAEVTTETSVSTGPVVTLADVITATKAGQIVYTSPAFHEALVASGDVEINTAMVDGNGLIATRATDKAMTDTTAPAAAEKPAPKFEIETGVAIPERTRTTTGLRAGRTAVYPFEALEIGQSFFVPNKSDDKPAVKAMASTVAGANARYTEEIAGETRVNRKGKTVAATKQLRRFKLFDSEKDGVKGARVFRVALDAAPAAE